MFRNFEITHEDEMEMISKVADMIRKRRIEPIAILTLDTLKPIAFISGQMARVFIQPFLIPFGRNTIRWGEEFLSVFENRANVEKLIKLLEEKAKEDSEKSKKKRETRAEEAQPNRIGWRRFIPF